MTETLNLENDTLVPGNFVAASCANYTAATVTSALGPLFVACTQPSTVVALNESSGLLEEYVHVGDDPVSMVFDPSYDDVYVANNGSDSLTVLSAVNDSVVTAVPVAEHTNGIAYDGADGALFVISYLSGNVTEIAPTTNTVVRVVSLGAAAGLDSIAFNPFNNDLYVAESGTSTVAVLSGTNLTTIASIPMGGQPSVVSCAPATGEVYVGVYIPTANSNPLRLVSGLTQRVVGNVSVGFAPDAIAFDSQSSRVEVANGGSANLSVIAAGNDTVLASIPVSYDPVALTQDNSTGVLYSVDRTSDNVAVINESHSKTTGFMAFNPGPDQLAWNGLAGQIDATGIFSGGLAQVNGTTGLVSSNLPVWSALTGLAVDTNNGHTYLASGSGSEVYDVGSNGTISTSVPVGDWPTAVAFDGANDLVFSSSLYDDSVSVINSTNDSVVGTVSLGGVLGAEPYDIVYGQDSGDLFIAVHGCLCLAAGNITILDATTGRFVGAIDDWVNPGPSAIAVDTQDHELYVTDDYSNVLWAFNLTTFNLTSVTPVGTAPEAVLVDPLSGYVYVTNSGSNNVTVVNSSNNAVLGSIRVGTDPLGLAFDPATGDIYVADEGSGSLSVITGAYAPVASFTESGLPSGTEWWVNVTGQVSEHSTGVTIATSLADGHYSYTAAAADQQFRTIGGTLNLSGSATSIRVTFTQLTYDLTFVEGGLPSGTPWAVTVNGTALSSDSLWINFTLQSGPYAYLVGSEYWYQPSPAQGEISVANHNLTVQVAFSHVLDQFVAAESNLPEGTIWSMTVGNTTDWSSQTTLEFNLTNGSYVYSIPSVSGYAASGLVRATSNATEFAPGVAIALSGELPIFARWVNATFVFTRETGSVGGGGLLGLSDLDWLGIAVLIGVSLVATFTVVKRRRASESGKHAGAARLRSVRLIFRRAQTPRSEDSPNPESRTSMGQPFHDPRVHDTVPSESFELQTRKTTWLANLTRR